MAVTKLWSVTERLGQVIDYATNPEKTSAKIKREFSPEQYQALADVIAYAKDEEKTEREFYVEGINCNVAIARDQFITVKEQYQKTDGIQAYHGYLSFKETDISPEMAQKIGMEFANEVWGKRFQVVVTTHLNTKHLHCHFVVNSVSFVDGKHLWGEEKAWFKFRKVADRICEKYGLYYDPNPNRSKQSDYLTMKEKAGMPTRYSVAKEAIDYAIDHSKTLKEFQFALKEMGYAYNLSPSRKYWTVIPKGYDKPIRLKNLGADYTNDRIVERIKENRDRWAEIEPFQRATYKPRQYRMQTRGQKLKKKGGLYGLYLYYCYRLGYLPKYKKQNNARLHYLLKDDLMKLDKITDEVEVNESVKKTLNTSLKMISDNNMYTSVPFEKGTDARNVLETTMSNLAKQDRETVITNLSNGMNLEQAISQFNNDTYFNQWYTNTKSQLESLIK